MSKIWLVNKKYRYSEKFTKALEEGDTKYIEKLIKKGHLMPVDEVMPVDEEQEPTTFTYKIRPTYLK